MSEINGTLTHLRPLIDEVLDRRPFGDPWIEQLWRMAARSRSGVATSAPSNFGTLVIEDAPSDRAARVGKVYERPIAPPAAFLRWLLEHPEAMDVSDRETFGAKSEDVRSWRRRLFSGNAAEIAAAQSEGLRQLDSRLAQRGRNKWWLFEGFSRTDACLVTDTCVLFVDAQRADTFSSSTRWFPTRRQLWRNVEAAREFAGGKPFGLILAVADADAGLAALADADTSIVESYPHLSTAAREELAGHLLGFVAWPEVVSTFDLPAV